MRNQTKKIITFVPYGEYYYQKALRALRQNRLEEARKSFERALERMPENADVLLNYSALLIEEGKYELAYEHLAKAHALDPEGEDIVFYLAEVHAHLGLLTDAKRYAEHYIALAPDGPLAEESMEIIDFAEQENIHLEEDDWFSGEIYFLQEQARRKMEEGQFDEASQLFERIVADYPQFLAASNNLALTYFYAGRVADAKAILRDVLKQDQGNIHALCNFAVIYYYEKEVFELEKSIRLLLKIKPIEFEHRYKLGATLALIGEHEAGYNWLRLLQRGGFEGDVSFYFWLSHSAYFSGRTKQAQLAYDKLVQLDPSKEGMEPWKERMTKNVNAYEDNIEMLVHKIQNPYRSERLFGYFLVLKSMYREERSILELMTFDKLSEVEKLYYGLIDEQFELYERKELDYFSRSIEVADTLYAKYAPLKKEGIHLLQMWFALCDVAYDQHYLFKNPNAIAAAADYMYQSSRYNHVTKKVIAEEYDIAPATLTKYVNELIEFLPIF